MAAQCAQTLHRIQTQNAQLVAMQQALSASSLVGQTVSYTDTDGSTKAGPSAIRIARRSSTSEPFSSKMFEATVHRLPNLPAKAAST